MADGSVAAATFFFGRPPARPDTYKEGNRSALPETEGLSLDLPNDFEFDGFSWNSELGKVILSWEKSRGSWVAKGVPANLRIVFDAVSFFKVDFAGRGHGILERRTLMFVGYLHPEDVETMGGCLDERASSDEVHMIFGFENGLSVKVYSDLVSARR